MVMKILANLQFATVNIPPRKILFRLLVAVRNPAVLWGSHQMHNVHDHDMIRRLQSLVQPQWGNANFSPTHDWPDTIRTKTSLSAL
jgi:hypothetical protein